MIFYRLSPWHVFFVLLAKEDNNDTETHIWQISYLFEEDRCNPDSYRDINGKNWGLSIHSMVPNNMKERYSILNIDDQIGIFIVRSGKMEKAKKNTGKKSGPRKTKAKKTRKVTLLDAAIIGAKTPTMGGL